MTNRHPAGAHTERTRPPRDTRARTSPVSTGPHSALSGQASKRIAIATCAALPDGFEDDHHAVALLGGEYATWTDAHVDWQDFDRVLIRSTWDYTSNRTEFVQWAHSVGAGRLLNAPALIEWNSDKSYLRDIDAPTVPTTFVGPTASLPRLEGEVVVKPTISAGAVDTGRFSPSHHDRARALVKRITDSGRTAMIQPYLRGIGTKGETALVFIGGELSHVLHKKPVLRPNEIAPLAEATGSVVAAKAMFDPDLVTAGQADAAQIALAERVIGQVSDRFGVPTFARVDLVPGPDAEPILLELEAVEPCLYLDTAPGAAAKLADAVLRS
ncbi:hypothetical protein K3N28_15795 [Glycomyces sp. TRM65418]|uniref:ATP-grasp domain-containing protein n=1 Tax=Glycomyces sp. TRM65418 TaxID=2867006 RepID=UPI001CE4C6E5|nr:hypothetical protein [Glycomyces sp. TRM65418]MCC3764526.1 hypothetical protein [Glycomyces sp. TRM65418]QZD54193.1 hypothetical protein K3N28_15715 [Glycomyces sp. TRM65418]